MYNRSLKTFHIVCRGLYLVCSVHFSWCFIYLDKLQRHEHCLDYTQLFFLNKKFQAVGQCMVTQERINVCETMGRKNNCKLNFFSMYFIRNNEEIHLSFKNVKNSRPKLQVLYSALWIPPMLCLLRVTFLCKGVYRNSFFEFSQTDHSPLPC